jgi:hypothetical protein
MSIITDTIAAYLEEIKKLDTQIDHVQRYGTASLSVGQVFRDDTVEWIAQLMKWKDDYRAGISVLAGSQR